MNTLRSHHIPRTFFVVLIVVGIFALGVYAGSSRADERDYSVAVVNKDEGKPSDVDFALFWKVWNELESRYIPTKKVAPAGDDKTKESTKDTKGTTAPTDQEKIYAAIQGLTAAYGDPYTVFFPPEESKAFNEEISGAFEGIGCEIGNKDGQLVVIAPLKNSPAYKAGLQPEDVITNIDATDASGMSVDEAIKLIRGKKGTTVTLVVQRTGASEPITVPIVRDVISIPTVETIARKDGVFVIKLYNFSEHSPEKFREALTEFITSGNTRLVLDLRGNPGGYLEAAQDIGSWFIEKGKVIVREDFKDDEPQVYASKGYDLFGKNLKMVVLIDGGSASASEILAGALSEYGKATLIGSQSFGKGSVQELIKISSLTSLKVTIARWLTPKGNSISNGGLTPTIEVKRTIDDIKAGKDPQLDAAVDFLLKK